MTKGGRDYSVLPNNRIDRGVSGVTSLFVSHQEGKKEGFFSPKVSANCVHTAQCNFCRSTPKSLNYKLSPCGARERERGGRGLV